MKFTSKDLMKAMCLQVGDRVKVILSPNHSNIFTLVNDENEGLMIESENEKELYSVEFLVDLDYEILPRPKRVGDLKCGDFKDCNKCPIRTLSNCNKADCKPRTLYKLLDMWNDEYLNFDQEIYDLLKARLDKEVSE